MHGPSIQPEQRPVAPAQENGDLVSLLAPRCQASIRLARDPFRFCRRREVGC